MLPSWVWLPTGVAGARFPTQLRFIGSSVKCRAGGAPGPLVFREPEA